MYLNSDVEHVLNVEFSNRLHKETVIDVQRKLAITRVLKKGTSPENDEFYLTQIRSIDAKNDKTIIKFYDNYKVYYEVNNGTSKIIIQDISQKVKNKDIDALLDIKMPDDCPAITIEEDGTIHKNKEFLDKDVLSDYFSKILDKEAKLSNGVDFGISPMVFKLYTILHNSQLKRFPRIEQLDSKSIFENVKDPDAMKLNSEYKDDDNAILTAYNLPSAEDKPEPNFAIIPIVANAHISTIVIDLRDKASREGSNILNFFDTSGSHIRLKNKSDLGELRLNKQSLQLTGCCGYWTSCFIEECSEIEDIEEMKKQFKTGEMQLKVACKVSEIIDTSFGNNRLLQRIEQEREHKGDNNYITINIKGTNKYFLLDRKNIYKSLCVNLKGISKLLAENKDIEISQDDLKSLREESKHQREVMIDKINKLCQPIIDEAKSVIKQVDEILKSELNDSRKKASGGISSLSVDIKQEIEITDGSNLQNASQSKETKDNPIKFLDLSFNSEEQIINSINYLKLKFFSEYLNDKYLFISKYNEEYEKVYDNVIKSEQVGVDGKQLNAATTDDIQQSPVDNKQTVINDNQTNNDGNDIQKVIEIIKTKIDVDKHIEEIKNSDEQNKENLEKLDKFYNKYIHPDLSEEFGKLQLKQSQPKQTKSLQEQTKLLSSLMSLDQDISKLSISNGMEHYQL